MMTFLPLTSFSDTAKVLDTKRLGCQRIEARMIMQIHLENKYPRWRNHPCVQMWKNNLLYLSHYAEFMCDHWKIRGYIDNTLPIIKSLRNKYLSSASNGSPFWFQDDQIFSNHRSILLGKNYEHYKQFGWEESPAVKLGGSWPYYFPKGI